MRRFTLVTLALTAVVSFLVGAIFAGGVTRSAVVAGSRAPASGAAAKPANPGSVARLPNVDFADAVERINRAVVSIDATSRVEGRRRRPRTPLPEPPDQFNEPFDFGTPRYDRDPTRRGAGSGFIIDADGSILTNNHVIEHAERITVKLSDGRSLRARLIGADPDTDIALISVDGQAGLPVAPLGDSSTLRMGEWVCAIGNPLGYDHSVTVGVVSYLGRKLFDQALDNYIQTDAAINFGNSGGPLINARGEVIGINAAISSRASSIGFAVPINGARAILPQLRARGSVSRGFMGVTPKDLDADLQRTLNLGVSRGALVQDVTDGSPADRAGLRVYDVIVGLDEQAISTDDQLIREIAARAPGTAARVRFVRGGRPQTVTLKLETRPARAADDAAVLPPAPPERRSGLEPPLGLNVRDLDRQTISRLRLDRETKGVLISRVEPMSASFDGGLERDSLLLEINRERVEGVADFKRIAGALKPGSVVVLFIYAPALEQHQLKTVRVDR
ncbi:MAG: trypsin-like peptidase domain-containing protein [Acidobacteriota bacterium]